MAFHLGGIRIEIHYSIFTYYRDHVVVIMMMRNIDRSQRQKIPVINFKHFCFASNVSLCNVCVCLRHNIVI